uniref:Uncharacterized protein n=1 Tax=Talaromyces marneffei PM1 TaxID=1077442 RepID=A0A093V758_TALMA
MTLVEVCADGIIRKRTTARDRESTQVVVTLESKEKVEKAADELYRKYIKESEKTSKTEKRSRKRRRLWLASCHEPSSAQHHPNRSNESRPNRTRSESDTIDEEVTAASTHDLSAETQPDPFSTVQVSLAGTEESPGPSVSRGRTAISTGESTPEVYGSGVMTSEATSFNVSDHWISSRATDYNSQFQLVNNELSPEQADLCPSTFRSPQIASAVSAHQESAPQDPESLRHPVQCSQGTETYRNCAYYAQLPVTATAQPKGTTNEISFNEQSQQPAGRAVQDGLQFASQGFEEIRFDIWHPTDPHGFEAVSFDPQGSAWFAGDSQGFEQVSFDPQNRVWRPAPSQGFENISFDENHNMISW